MMRSAILSCARPVALLLALSSPVLAGPRHGHLPPAPDDYRVRHPINVTRGLASIDLLPGGGPGGLTDRQVGDIQFFADDWRKRGRGRLTIQTPVGGDPVADGQSARAVKEIRRIFAAMSISGRAVAVVRYQAEGPGHLAPVRLEFPVIEARLPHDCGQWPDDLGYSDPGSSNRNSQYWNYGCATQQNLAAQVEDPEDFIRPRAETPPSATRRATTITKYNKGETVVSDGEVASDQVSAQ